MKAAVLITGSNRGLGLEWSRQYAGLGWRVHATCRLPEEANDLQQLADAYPNVTIHRLDITQPDEIVALADTVSAEAIDVLINNAGVYYERWGKDPLGQIDYADWEATLRVNTLGCIRVTEALRNPIARSTRRLVVAITSHMGSITDITSPRDYAYRSSKAALNAAMKGMSHELNASGIGVLLLHPGWVRTRMGGSDAPLSPAESVRGMRSVIDQFDMSRSGHFYSHDGVEISW